jgi:hypothetical protein
MHFDEVIAKIKEAQTLSRDAAGRLVLGSGCTVVNGVVRPLTCTIFATIDSPQENIAMYHRLMKYGHFQTDPAEIDDFGEGGEGGEEGEVPATHPALGPEDYAKFRAPLGALLPVPASQAKNCFPGLVSICHDPQELLNRDFVLAASFLAAAGDKTGQVTVDLVQYTNRILRIAETTPDSTATLRTLPALIRDCPGCAPYAAPAGLPWPASERFVDFARARYVRTTWFDKPVDVLKPSGVPNTFVEDPAVPLLGWLAFINPPPADGIRIDGFVKNMRDALRTIEFVHNYAVPEDLGWDFTP